ncbi:MAG: hypothetical protein SGI73_16820 [Chloroflexota bacterium]|nr:hypothetical protein [Chloroflexota bacterium]
MTRFVFGTFIVIGALVCGALGATFGAVAALPYAGEIAYMVYNPINPDIVLQDVGRGAVFNLTRDAAYDAAPTWSPDGRWLAFISNRGDGGNQVFIMTAHGRDLRRLTDGVGTYSAPRWSSDGARIVFFALHIGANALFSVNVDGSELHQVSGETVTPGAVMMDLGIDTASISRALSPDRQRMMFLAYRAEAWGIYVARRVESGGFTDDRLLTTISNFSEIPVWSPDGQRVAFISWTGGTSDVYIINVPPLERMSASDAILPTRLTATRAIDSSPAWRPR